MSIGRVSNEEGVNLRARPDTKAPILKRLPFNTRVFVGRELPGDWFLVTLDDGSFGYVYTKYVMTHPPEPGAFLHRIKPGEGALGIVQQHYKGSAIEWGKDERYYVNVLVEANRAKEVSGIYKPSPSMGWEKTKTRENYLIWIPTVAFADGLRGKVGSGSISYNAWQTAKQAAQTVADVLIGSAAFVAGLLHGALESVWDLVTGLVDLVKLVWDILESIIKGKLLDDVASLWRQVSSIDAKALIASGMDSFAAKWNAPDLLRRWHFRGWAVGYAIAEIAMAVMTGAAALVKWAGKAGKIGKLIAKFPKVVKLAQQVTEVSKRVPESSLKKLKQVVARAPEKAPVPKKTKPSHLPSKTKADKSGANEASIAGENGELPESHKALTETPPKPKKGFVRFRSDYDAHIIKRDYAVKHKNGIGGAHNKAEFMKYVHEVNVLKIEPHPTVPGVSTISYQMPALDKAGKPTGGWKAKSFEKTVYDPAIISDEKFLQMGRQAAAEAQDAGRMDREWYGFTPDGIKIRGYLDASGAVRSFFFDT